MCILHGWTAFVTPGSFYMALVNGGPCGIYKFTSPSGRVYIGQSINIRKRMYYYSTLCCKNQFKLYHSFLKYGFKAHKFEIIHVCEPNELNALEEHYIKVFNSTDEEHGLNLTTGGDSGKRSKETGDKISKARMGHSVSEETRKKLSERNKGKATWNKGIGITEEVRKKISDSLKGRPSWNKGKPCSEEKKAKISASKKGMVSNRKGCVLSEETKKKIAESRRKNKAIKKQKQWSLFPDL